MIYITMEIRITKGQSPEPGKTYLVSATVATRTGTRAAQAAFTMSPDIEDRLETILRASKVRDTGSLESQEASVRQFGIELFSYIFQSEVRNLYSEIKTMAAQTQAVIRLRLQIIPPELSIMPWELLHDSERYLCLSGYPKILFARVPDTISRRRALAYTPPLRLLGVTSNPKDEQILNIEEEKKQISNALNTLVQEHQVEYAWETAKAEVLRDLRRGAPWHILHFIGHGRFDRASMEGKLIFEDEQGQTHNYDANQLSLALHKDIQLVFLNACDTARGDPFNYLSNFAYNLATSGVPAILAMQFKITDIAAIQFAKIFYERITSGDAVDDAVAEARHSIYIGTNRNRLDWAAPVLYISTSNNTLFKRAATTQSLAPAGQKKPTPAPIGTSSTGRKQTEIEVHKPAASTPMVAPKKKRQPFNLRAVPSRLPRLRPLFLLLSAALAIMLVAGAISWPNILGLFNRQAATAITTNCNINPLTPSTSPLVPFTMQTPGMKPGTGMHGDTIGLSAGSLIFDTVSPGYCELLQAAQYREANNPQNFTSTLNIVTSTTDKLDAEAKIYQEDDTVFSSGNAYVEMVVGGSFAPSNIGSTTAMLQGAYIAQKEYNGEAQVKNEPLLVLIVANAGDNAQNTQTIADDIEALAQSQYNQKLIGTIGWPFSSYALNLNSALSKKNILLVSSAASSNFLSHRQWFARIVPPDAEQAHIAALYVRTLIKPSDPIAVMVASNDNNYSSSVGGSFFNEFSTPPILEKYDPNAPDPFSTVISDLINKQVALIYFTGYAGDMGKFLDTLARTGDLDRFKLMGGDSLSVVSDYKKGQDNLDRLTFTAFSSGNEWTDAQKAQAPIITKFLNDYASQFGSDPRLLNGFANLDTNTILAYDNTMVMLKAYQIAIQNGGANDIEHAMVNALTSIHGTQAFQGVSGQVSFEPSNGDPVKKQIIIASIQYGTVITKSRYNCFLVSDLAALRC